MDGNTKRMIENNKIEDLLLDIRTLERLVAGMRNEEMYPVSFFGETFRLTHKIFRELYALETDRIEHLRKQIEEHQAMVRSFPDTGWEDLYREVEKLNRTASEEGPSTRQETVPASESALSSSESASVFQPSREPATADEKMLAVVGVPQTIPDPEVTVASEPVTVSEPVMGSRPPLISEPIVIPESAAIPEPAVIPEPVVIPESAPEPSQAPVSDSSIASSKSSLTEKSGLFLNDLLEKQYLSDFRKAFSLNDRFRFRRELFGGDEEKMNRAIAGLNEIRSYEEAISYLRTELKWNVEDEAVADFVKLLEKRYL